MHLVILTFQSRSFFLLWNGFLSRFGELAVYTEVTERFVALSVVRCLA